MSTYQQEQEAKRAIARKRAKRFVFQPVGVDVYDRREHQPEKGAIVVKTQPHGCPKNGTMGHCYVEDAETGEFYGLVLENSLQPYDSRQQTVAAVTAESLAFDEGAEGEHAAEELGEDEA